MFQAVQECFRKYAVFSGRASRSEYWYFYLFSFVLIFFAGYSNSPNVITFIDLILIVPLLSAGVRRMHDVNRSGWFLLVPLYSLYLLVQPSDGANRFGAPPTTYWHA